MSFLPLKFEYANYSNDLLFVSISFNFFAKIMIGSCVFCCSSCITINPTSHLNSETMKILGVHFLYNKNLEQDKNFSRIL